MQQKWPKDEAFVPDGRKEEQKKIKTDLWEYECKIGGNFHQFP